MKAALPLAIQFATAASARIGNTGFWFLNSCFPFSSTWCPRLPAGCVDISLPDVYTGSVQVAVRRGGLAWTIQHHTGTPTHMSYRTFHYGISSWNRNPRVFLWERYVWVAQISPTSLEKFVFNKGDHKLHNSHTRNAYFWIYIFL